MQNVPKCSNKMSETRERKRERERERAVSLKSLKWMLGGNGGKEEVKKTRDNLD